MDAFIAVTEDSETNIITCLVANSKGVRKTIALVENVDYFHCTSNNTIVGTQMKAFPETKVSLVCDMSSDIFSRQLDFEKFDLIYAGAQKNMGPAGTTLVIIKEEILECADGKKGIETPGYWELFAQFYYRDVSAPEYCRHYSRQKHAFKTPGKTCLKIDGEWEIR